MSNTSKVVHPFFQQQQKQKATSPTIPLTSPIIEPVNVSPQYTPPVPVIQQTRLRARKTVPVTTTAVSKTVALKHVPAVASCSTPHRVPTVKPKFLSDTLQQQDQDHQNEFNFYGRIKPIKKLHDHEFSRFDRNVFGNSHIKQESHLVDSSEATQPPFTRRTNFEIKLDDITTDFFSKRQGRRKQRSTQPKLKKPNYHININNQEDLQAFMDRSFPNWHAFSSCVILSQIVFNRSNERKKNQQRQWVDDYRPKTVYGLLGDRYNSIYLKDWLHQMKIAPMSAPTPSGGIKKSKLVKKKKLVDDLDLLSLDVDDDDDFMPTKKTAKQLKNESIKSNIILVAGDHGVGKTTMVYTVAEQLGYEVFEINPGSRRSGKDIMSMVGEMTKSHHVTFGIQQQQVTTEETADAKKPKKRRLNPCLSSSLNKSESDDSPLKNFLRKKPLLPEKVKVKTSEPKQSLILLEEVDLLFEDDKAFWSSIIELSQKSKRPIVMTCNDPDQVPFESLYLQVVLEMKPPTDSELLPYLWLLCYGEGYIVDPADLICLMAFMGRDIRQLIQTLELYAKCEEPIFQSYMGIHLNESLASMKLKCVPSRVAVDTFRLARCYENIGDTKMSLDDNDDNDMDELEKIERALQDNALIDSWLGWKGNGNMIHEAGKDEINGFTTLWLEEDDAYECNNMLKEIESSISVTHSEEMKSSVWSNIICDESSHWDEACDSK
ncbi:hypothetical protein HPULCUR_004564 [Helicostylum pulchrum]|uniref:AAA+ ATPase domain-containing protein n=1 Tax=Helicostylum pulchrum TaxID=562976 RepID=A0ABP9XWJ7_9FUNG